VDSSNSRGELKQAAGHFGLEQLSNSTTEQFNWAIGQLNYAIAELPIAQFRPSALC
jgi:hypothetical protein